VAEAFAKKAGFDPLSSNIVDFVRSLGGTVAIEHDLTKLDTAGGSIQIDGPGKFTISISPLSSTTRDRFTIAHEIGHYVLHSRFGKLTGELRRDLSNSEIEWEANWFAAAFLMPAATVKYLIEEIGTDDPAELAADLKVSRQALEIHLEYLKSNGRI